MSSKYEKCHLIQIYFLYFIFFNILVLQLNQIFWQKQKKYKKKIPHNGKLKAALKIAYENLHLFAYYRGATGVKLVKEGF